jgi:hypothetical protein
VNLHLKKSVNKEIKGGSDHRDVAGLARDDRSFGIRLGKGVAQSEPQAAEMLRRLWVVLASVPYLRGSAIVINGFVYHRRNRLR